MQTYIEHHYADKEDETILAGYQIVYLTEENKFPISFGTNVACSGCFFKVISASDVADLSISLLMN